MSTIPETHADLLNKLVFWHIASNGPSGEPQSSPVWGDWDGEYFKFSLTKGRQKFRNLEASPEIALSGIDPDNSYRYLELRGRVERVDPDPSNAFIDSMAKKYLDVDAYPFHQPGDERVVIVVRPEHATSMG